MKNITQTDNDFVCQLSGWRLTTAEITYRMPDHRDILQVFVWQNYDIAPRFPHLKKFLHFWSHHLDGPLCSVRVACKGQMSAVLIPTVDKEWCVAN